MEVDEAGAGVSGATLAADLQELEGNSIILLKLITEEELLSEDGEGGLLAQAVAEMSGYLKLSDEEYDKARSSHPNLWKEARFILKYGSDSQGYWNSKKFMNQVKHTLTIAEIKYPRANSTIVFLFDQSSGHTAYDSDALKYHA